ncbi:FtsW/RodA/SpoVE family cell cycle protein [Jeotgalibacillus sp. ET6]|uniref:FtsW/RodA/SpoVE family cell cycle protein n=1 Tax=Jeotgalibacillus sp. ET6 TaxID=3037260 RepID=UPI002418B33C|nr:FtsW/RodA/SpoVE family cell cycle protein [Jeotgalibacillus sp. ET6]MDG5472015.1 FtsW/RodA/SpoVE family cell cycle protein [Jeotgalibacillus sp. ET6]
MSEKGDQFLKEVIHHIKSKEVKAFVKAELDQHLRKTSQTWMAKGLSENEAEDKAIGGMGSPGKLGREMNHLHRPRVDWVLLCLLGAALVLGFLPIFSLGTEGFMDMGHFLLYRVIFVILGILTAIGLMVMDYRKLMKKGWMFYIFGNFLLFMIGTFPNRIVNGQFLIEVGPLTIEALMALPFLLIAWAAFFHHQSMRLWQLGILSIIPIYFFLQIPNLHSLFLYTAMVFMMAWFSPMVKKKVMWISIVPLGAVVIGMFAFWFTADDYQLSRIMGYLNPEAYAEEEGYLYLHLQQLLSQAGWFGAEGSKEFLNAAHTDFVFVSLTYYFGYAFAIALLLILSFIAIRMIVISRQLKDTFGRLLLTGSMTLYAVQLIYNVGMVLGFLPLTSFALPFISYGLMPTLFNALLIGVVLSVYRRKHLTLNGNLIRH